MRRALAWWRRHFGPSLARRLLLAQLTLLLLMWCLVIGDYLYESARGESVLTPQPRYDMIVAVAEALADAPERRWKALAAIDTFQRTDNGETTVPPWSLDMLVRQHGRVVYASPGVPLSLQGPADRTVAHVQAEGAGWRVRSSGTPGRTEVTLVQRHATLELVLDWHSSTYLLLPLMISLPLLAFPAWLSVRLALQPLREASEAIANRGPHDLSPVDAVVRHRELEPSLHALNSLLARLRGAVERERAFIANAAHELRTPLAALRVNIEALREHAGNATQRELLKGTLSSVTRAVRLVAQLLALTRSEAIPGERHLLALGDLAQDSLAALAPLAACGAVELELEQDLPVWVMGERDSLMSVIDNLIDNAIKYSPPGATVTVCVRSGDGTAHLTVRDRGPGIPSVLRDQVFARFYRAPGQTQPGSGLGLCIVRAALASHGGAVSVGDPPDGAGLLASVSLPLARSP